MFRRDGTVFRLSGSNILAGSGYTVVAYRPGAIASGPATLQTIPVYAGHRFVGGEKLLIYTVSNGAFTYSGGATVLTANALSLVMTAGSYSVVKGDVIINLGVDTGPVDPLYTASPVAIYSDPGTAISQARVNTATDGQYGYYHAGINVWELVLNGSTAVDIIRDPILLNFDESLRYAHHFITGGDGSAASPWTYTGSNPVQAAINDLPITGGRVKAIDGHFSLGSATIAVTIPILANTLDTRAYTIEGAGRDLTFFEYSGTGTAIRYPGDVLQSNQLVLRGFSLLQTGTPRTGKGFWGTYVSESLFEDLNVGCLRMNHQAGEPDNGWAAGITLLNDGGSNVVDFNRFHRIYAKGNTVGLYIENQGDNTVISECSFEPRQDSTDTQSGVEIHNSYAVTVQGCHFNYFGKSTLVTDYGGLKISGNMNGLNILNNYFEGCEPYCIYLANDGTVIHKGVAIRGNSFSFNGVTASTGIRAGIDGATFALSGLNIDSNGFFVLSAGNIGIRYADSINNLVEGGNGFNNTGGTNRAIQRGCTGVILNGFTDNNTRPFIYLIDNTSENGRVYLENSSLTAGPSPRVHFKPGGAGSLSMSIYAAADGSLYILNDSGTLRAHLSQAGLWTTIAGITAGGVVTPSAGIGAGIARMSGTWQPPTATPGSYKAPVTTEMYVGSIFVPINMTVTGIQYLIGTAVPVAQKVIVALYSQAGTKVAQSVAGGTTMTGSASVKQQIPFNPGTYAAIGPGFYFIGLMFDTNTANLVAMIPAVADVGSGVVGAAITGLTAVTPPSSITPPTTFPGAALVPIASLY